MQGHSFDVARHGYVNMLPGDARPGTADTAAMVDARARFLEAGHFKSVADEVAASAWRVGRAEYVVEAGAGTGYYLAETVDVLNARAGLALDISKYACRRAARAHPRIGAAVCDVWAGLPVRSGSTSLALSVFAPRNGSELRRILRPDGALIVVTPAREHLQEIVGPLGLLSVDEHKASRLDQTLGGHFELADTRRHESFMSLDRDEVRILASMGPSARHVSEEELAIRAAALAEPIVVTISVDIGTYRPRSSEGA